MSKSLLSIGNPKTMKGQKKGYLTGILHLLPSNYSSIMNVCPDASPGCKSTCLNFAGRGQFSSTQLARKKKNELLKKDKAEFMRCLHHDITLLVNKAAREHLVPVVRLNGTSDLPWETMPYFLPGPNPLGPATSYANLMEAFPEVQFYDYTKSQRRMNNYLESLDPDQKGIVDRWPENYSLTFSRSELNESFCQSVLNRGGRVAIVFKKLWADGMLSMRIDRAHLAGWDRLYPVVNGEEDDLRFSDPGGIIALKAKGLATKDQTGFVVPERNVEWFFTSTRKEVYA